MSVLALEDRRSGAACPPLLIAVVQALPQPTIIVSSDLRVLAINSAVHEILPAVRTGDLLARSLRAPTILDAAARVDQSGGRETVVWRDRFPIEHVFEVCVAALVPPDQPRALIITFDDQTETRRVEQMRVDFIANASHELRTPLASVLGFVETLQGPARDDARARERFLGIMAEQARRMARLVDDLLSLSRIEQKRHIKPSDGVDLSTVVRHVCDTLSTLASDNGMTLDLAVDPGIVVTGDRDELVRVVENLIENAIKYGQRTGAGKDDQRIRVTVTADRCDGRLTVQDFGDGIAAEHIPRLTERFYRIDAGQSRAKGGTGLGLALVKHIVAHHRGRLAIESVVGKGTIFTVSVPIHKML